jgi:protein TonB
VLPPSETTAIEILPLSGQQQGWMRSFAVAVALHGVVIVGAIAINGILPLSSPQAPPQDLETELMIIPVILTPAAPAPQPAPEQTAPEQTAKESATEAEITPEPEALPKPEATPEPEPIAEPQPVLKPTPATLKKPTPPAAHPVPKVTAPVQPQKAAFSAPAPAAPSPPKIARPAPPGPSNDSLTSADDLRRWQQALAAHLERYKTYPRQARLLRQQGVVSINITIDQAGRVIAATLHQSSGSAALDAATLDLIQRAPPLPKPPIAAQGTMNAVVPLRYQLR